MNVVTYIFLVLFVFVIWTTPQKKHEWWAWALAVSAMVFGILVLERGWP